MELVPDETLPDLVEFGAVVGQRAEPVGCDGGPLGRTGQLFVAAIVVLHRRLRGIAPRGVHIHEQLAVVRGQLVLTVEIGEEQVVARGADHLDRRLRIVERLGQPAAGGDRAAVAHVAHVVAAARIVAEAGVVETVGRTLHQTRVILHVFGQFVAVAARIEGRQQRAAVDAVPHAPREGILPVIGCVVEVAAAPAELLRREADQPAVRGQRRQRIAEAEAVGQEDVGRTHAELALVELLSEQDVADERLGRGHVRVVGIPRSARDMPLAAGDVPLHPFVLQGIVLLHPFVLHGAFEAEAVVGEPLHEVEILEERAGDVLADGGLHVPVPLRVEVRIAHQVGLVGLGSHGGPLLPGCSGRSCRRRQRQYDGEKGRKFHKVYRK